MNESLRSALINVAKQHATPIDYEQLVKDGLIEKKGAWFKINNFEALPEHVKKQIREMKIDNHGNCFVKLPTSWKKAQKTYEKMSGEGWRK